MPGFTLLELIIVILVLGIVAALGAPALLSSLDDAHLDAAASEVATALRFAQLSATATGRATRVTIDVRTDTLLVEQVSHANLRKLLNAANAEIAAADVESGESFRVVNHPTRRMESYSVSIGDDRFGGVDIASAAFDGGPSVAFSGSGAPSSAGSVLLTLGGRRVTVTIDDLAGRVSIAE